MWNKDWADIGNNKTLTNKSACKKKILRTIQPNLKVIVKIASLKPEPIVILVRSEYKCKYSQNTHTHTRTHSQTHSWGKRKQKRLHVFTFFFFFCFSRAGIWHRFREILSLCWASRRILSLPVPFWTKGHAPWNYGNRPSQQRQQLQSARGPLQRPGIGSRDFHASHMRLRWGKGSFFYFF